MVIMSTRLKRMGNSLGIVVPSEIVNKNGLREGEELEVDVKIRGRTTIGDMLKEAKRQKLKFRSTTAEIFAEIDKEE